jgi:hypothetical protein
MLLRQSADPLWFQSDDVSGRRKQVAFLATLRSCGPKQSADCFSRSPSGEVLASSYHTDCGSGSSSSIFSGLWLEESRWRSDLIICAAFRLRGLCPVASFSSCCIIQYHKTMCITQSMCTEPFKVLHLFADLEGASSSSQQLSTSLKCSVC